MKMKIAVLEDQPVEAQNLKTELNLWSQKNNFSVEITEYSSGEEFFRQNSAETVQNFNVFFLDIQLKGISGIDVAKKLRRGGYQGAVIFLTAFREYVFHGYEVHALNYLLKPVQSGPLFLCLDEIAGYLAGSSYLYRSRREIVSIPYRDILSFSSSLHYVDILTVTGSFCQYSTLSSIIAHLPGEFIRTHRSYIVNMAHIYKITGNTIVLSNNMTLQIGRSYLKQVASSFSEYSIRFDKGR